MGVTVWALCLALLGPSFALASGNAPRLPARVSEPGFVERIPSPAGGLVMFYLFQPGQQARFGVARPDDTVVWQMQVGFRPITHYVWADHGRRIVFVTDCTQPDAELRAANSQTRSYYFTLEPATGTVVAEGDLDTDVLDLPHRMPEAVGSAHEIERLDVVGGVLEVVINHRGARLSGRLPIGKSATVGAGATPAPGDASSRCLSRSATYRPSSTFSSAYPPLSGLLDDRAVLHAARLSEDSSVAPEFAFHSSREERPYIVIDLGDVAQADRIVIENRRRQCQARARDLTLWTSLDGANWTWRWTANQARAAWQVRFPGPVRARFFMLGLRHADYLHLARVEIFGSMRTPEDVRPGVEPLAGEFVLVDAATDTWSWTAGTAPDTQPVARTGTIEVTLVGCGPAVDPTTSPRQGHEYVVVTLKIKNLSSAPMSGLSENDFQLRPASGRRHGPVSFVQWKDQLPAVTLITSDLAPGAAATGQLLYEIPVHERGRELHYIKGSKPQPELVLRLDP